MIPIRKGRAFSKGRPTTDDGRWTMDQYSLADSWLQHYSFHILYRVNRHWGLVTHCPCTVVGRRSSVPLAKRLVLCYIAIAMQIRPGATMDQPGMTLDRHTTMPIELSDRRARTAPVALGAGLVVAATAL